MRYRRARVRHWSSVADRRDSSSRPARTARSARSAARADAPAASGRPSARTRRASGSRDNTAPSRTTGDTAAARCLTLLFPVLERAARLLHDFLQTPHREQSLRLARVIHHLEDSLADLVIG